MLTSIIYLVIAILTFLIFPWIENWFYSYIEWVDKIKGEMNLRKSGYYKGVDGEMHTPEMWDAYGMPVIKPAKNEAKKFHDMYEKELRRK